MIVHVPQAAVEAVEAKDIHPEAAAAAVTDRSLLAQLHSFCFHLSFQGISV